MFCPKCGIELPRDSKFCIECGEEIFKNDEFRFNRETESEVINSTHHHQIVQTNYAGFWKRLAAFLIDTIILFILAFAIGSIIGFAMRGLILNLETAENLGSIIGIIVAWTYYAVMESSSKKATFGKMLLKIIVTDMKGNRISFLRATGRHFGKIISGILLCAGYIMVAFTKRKQGLHDIMAGCLVLSKS